MFEAADRDPALIDQGALNFVVVGGGPTGVELAGALADLIAETMTVEYHDLAVSAAQIHLVDLGHALLGAVLGQRPRLRRQGARPQGRPAAPGRGVTEVGAGHVTLADGTDDPDPLRRLGRRHQGAAARGAPGSAAGAAGASTSSPT